MAPHPGIPRFAADADDLVPEAKQEFYRRVLRTLKDGGVEFMVGGAYAFTRYTGIARPTKDFDLFVRYRDLEAALARLAADGFQTEFTFSHWLGKAYKGDEFVDLIFSSGNGVAAVDDLWFEHAPTAEVLGVTVRLTPPEEMIWSKSFVIERERCDVADVLHILHACGPTLDWRRLVTRYGRWWRVLMAHLVLFGFTYPGERTKIPVKVLDAFLDRFKRELHRNATRRKLCQGTLFSRQQFLVDVERWGYEDARLDLHGGNMTAGEVDAWTAAIFDERKPARTARTRREDLEPPPPAAGSGGRRSSRPSAKGKRPAATKKRAASKKPRAGRDR